MPGDAAAEWEFPLPVSSACSSASARSPFALHDYAAEGAKSADAIPSRF